MLSHLSRDTASASVYGQSALIEDGGQDDLIDERKRRLVLEVCGFSGDQ
jgi:hypothetical protein